MPTANQNLRSLMEKWFGDEISESGPVHFLQSRGWYEKGGMLEKPTLSYNPSIYEAVCVNFLCDEWDFACENFHQTL